MKNEITLNALAKMIDHSLLHPTMTDEIIEKGCQIAKKYSTATVCVKPYAVEMAVKLLKGSETKVCSVVTFPHGNSTTKNKCLETEEACKLGAAEIDMVANIGKVLGGDLAYVEAEIRAVNEVCLNNRAILKVIFENDYLQDRHIIELCGICAKVKPAFVKTSTGYGFVKQANGMYNYKGATLEHLKLMRKHCPPEVQIKAAGGVRSLEELLKVRELGVTRIGATATEAILEEAKKRGFN